MMTVSALNGVRYKQVVRGGGEDRCRDGANRGGAEAWVWTDAGLGWSSMVPGTNLSGAVMCGR